MVAAAKYQIVGILTCRRLCVNPIRYNHLRSSSINGGGLGKLRQDADLVPATSKPRASSSIRARPPQFSRMAFWTFVLKPHLVSLFEKKKRCIKYECHLHLCQVLRYFLFVLYVCILSVHKSAVIFFFCLT